MKVFISWLAEYVDLGECADPARLAAAFESAGIQVAGREGEGVDTVLELEVTANRPDLLSHFGLARELAALLERDILSRGGRPDVPVAAIRGLTLKTPHLGLEIPAGGNWPIEIESDRCDRYMGLVMRGVTIGPSPEWMAHRLTRVGLRPISNVVDVTNYVLLELNHPLHAFDLAKLASRIVVRQAREGESIALLDGSAKALSADDLVIADAEKPVALAGVMGGSATAVSEMTTDLLLEAAWFLPASVRRTARRHGVSSDSSYRFERGADYDAIPIAMRRMVHLIQTTAGGKIEGGLIDVRRKEHPPRRVRFRASSVKRHLGCEVPTAGKILASIGAKADGDGVIVPSWRGDLEREIDCVEEIARLWGYDKIGSTLPALKRTPDFHAGLLASRANETAAGYRRFRSAVAESLLRQGLDRTMTFTFETPAFGDVPLANPIHAELSTMRATLLPSLCRTARIRADSAGVRSALIYELDKVFRVKDGRPTERDAVAVLLAGEAEPKRYDGRAADVVVFDHALGVLRELAADLSLSVELRDSPTANDDPFAHHAALLPLSALVVLGGSVCGRIGRIDRSKIPSLDADPHEPAYGFELDLTALWLDAASKSSVPRYRPLPRFPASSRDLAFFVDPLVPVGAVLDAVRAAGAATLESLEVFDVFASKREQKTSVGVRCVFRSSERTLTDAEVNDAVSRIVASVTDRCGAQLRAQ